MLTPTYLTTNPSEECPQAYYSLFYYKTCHYLPQVKTHGFEGVRLLSPLLPGKAIKRLFSTSPQTLSLRFDLVLVYRDGIWVTIPPHFREAPVILLRCTSAHKSTTLRPSTVLRVRLEVLFTASAWELFLLCHLAKCYSSFLSFFTGRLPLPAAQVKPLCSMLLH